MPDHGHHMNDGPGPLGALLTFLAVALLLIGAVGMALALAPLIRRRLAEMRGAAPHAVVGSQTGASSAREILDRRLAEGTIDVADYRERVAELHAADVAPTKPYPALQAPLP